MFAEKFQAFMTWWYSVFATWDPDRLPSYLFWFLQDNQMASVPETVALILLVVIACTILTLIAAPFEGVDATFSIRLIAIPVAFLGIIGLHFANTFIENLVKESLPSFSRLFNGEIPEAWMMVKAAFAAEPDIQDIVESIAVLLTKTVIGVPVILFAFLFYSIGALICLSPFIGLLIADLILHKWMGPVHFIADVGGGVLLVIGAAIAIFCASFYFVGIMILLFFTGGVMLSPLIRLFS